MPMQGFWIVFLTGYLLVIHQSNIAMLEQPPSPPFPSAHQPSISEVLPVAEVCLVTKSDPIGCQDVVSSYQSQGSSSYHLWLDYSTAGFQTLP